MDENDPDFEDFDYSDENAPEEQEPPGYGIH